MKHFIITRLGLGRRDSEFYQEHLNLCRLSLVKSLEAQTCSDFIWVVVTDVRAPKWVQSEVRGLSRKLNIVIWRMDPFRSGMKPVDDVRLQELADGQDIITTRIDDDDMLHRTFVADVQARMMPMHGTVALTYANGFDLTHKSAGASLHPWCSQGLSVRSPPDPLLHAYSFSHTKTGVGMIDGGGQAIVVEDAPPLWTRTWRSNSDSSRARGIRASDDSAGAIRYLSRDFGLGWLELQRLQKTLTPSAKPVDEQKGVFLRRPLPNMALKLHLLAEVRRLRKNAGSPQDIERMAQAFYLL